MELDIREVISTLQTACNTLNSIKVDGIESMRKAVNAHDGLTRLLQKIIDGASESKEALNDKEVE